MELTFDDIVMLRGGVNPTHCDFCGKAFTEENYATPEEAGEWACIECVKRWDARQGEKHGS